MNKIGSFHDTHTQLVEGWHICAAGDTNSLPSAFDLMFAMVSVVEAGSRTLIEENGGVRNTVFVTCSSPWQALTFARYFNQALVAIRFENRTCDLAFVLWLFLNTKISSSDDGYLSETSFNIHIRCPTLEDGGRGAKLVFFFFFFLCLSTLSHKQNLNLNRCFASSMSTFALID